MLVRWLTNWATPFQRNCQLIVVSFCLGLFASGCEEKKIVQCEQIFQIVRDVTKSNRDINYANSKQSASEQSWLKAANRLALAADSVDALKISQSQLVQYQKQLAAVYRIYSQATYDAVQARQNKDLESLQDARRKATKAGKMQQNLIQRINNYCLYR